MLFAYRDRVLFYVDVTLIFISDHHRVLTHVRR